MAPVATRSIKEEIKATCHGGRVLGVGFSLAVVLVVQPLVWVRRGLSARNSRAMLGKGPSRWTQAAVLGPWASGQVSPSSRAA